MRIISANGYRYRILGTVPANRVEELADSISDLKKLYSSSSINLLIVAGLIFLLINSNIYPFYDLMSEKAYSNGVWVVLMISISKLFLMSLIIL